jgi:hypothetical protein
MGRVQREMVFVSENEKTEFFSLEKTGIFSLLWMFLGGLCVLANLFDVFHGCQQQFMSVLWYLSVRMEKQEFSHFYGCFLDGYVCWSIYLMFFSDVNSNLCLFYDFCQLL